MAEDRVRIEIGFDGGQVMGVVISATSADQLERGLAAGEDGALNLEAEDGRYTVALRRVVYLKRFAREGRVGFTNS